jgi:hypothetical protein
MFMGKLQELVNNAIDNWLQKGKPVPTTIRRAVRENQELGKRASSTSRELALHFLTTSAMNVFCLYHSNNDKKGGKYDGQEGEKYQVVGIPLKRDANKVKQDRKICPKGHMHCGCEENNALADFYIWKNWVAESGGYKEGMKDDIMDPRTRSFVVGTGLNSYARIFTDDLYTENHSAQDTKKALILNQIARLKNDLQKLEIEDEKVEQDKEEENEDDEVIELIEDNEYVTLDSLSKYGTEKVKIAIRHVNHKEASLLGLEISFTISGS